MTIQGRRPTADEMPVELYKGWNWIAYTPLTTMQTGAALAGAQPKVGDIIKSQSAVAIYSEYGWEGTLKALEPGHGYKYFSTDASTRTFVYSEESYAANATGILGAPSGSVSGLAAKRSGSANGLSGEAGLTWFLPVDKHLYPSNMTMTIRLMDGDAVVDTCEIAAFVGDECRGRRACR